MAIAEDRKKELLYRMTRLLLEGVSPDDAFKRVADDAYISGRRNRRSLRNAWKRSQIFQRWAASNPEEAKELCWD